LEGGDDFYRSDRHLEFEGGKTMKRGSTIKKETDERLVLERRMITKRYVLELNRGKCVGCQIGLLACPQEAVWLLPGVVSEGKLVKRPLVDFDADKCNFCGECVVLCPTNALSLTVNGEREIPVLKFEAFPSLIKEIGVEVEKCKPTCDLVCQDRCPTDCIEVVVRRAEGEVVEILDVKVNREECIYCVECEAACPEGAISVVKPWEGRINLNISLCPEGCRACVDICPTDALFVSDEKIALDERFCLFCGACEEVCPEEGALLISRRRILHTEVKSAAWTAALEKLVSLEAVVQELDSKSQAKRRQAIRYLPSAGRTF
jgi:4Fe-4S ferredoxin